MTLQGAPLDPSTLARLLTQAVPRLSLAQAARILAAHPLQTLVRETPEILADLCDLTPHQAGALYAGLQLGRLTLTHAQGDRPRLNTPAQLAAYLLPLHGHHPEEHFGIVTLDTKHRVLGVRMVSVGSLDATIVHPREVFRQATADRAACIVLFHNHPSGDPSPSPDDLLLTTRLVNAGTVMGIDVVDHVVLAGQKYFSFVEAGRLHGTT